VNKCIETLAQKVGRIILNDVPTGVRVTQTMQHGGPFPASSDARFTAVGTDSMKRFQKYVSIQQKNRT
jgi:NADP-dependent aldehyde dehydrogenase